MRKGRLILNWPADAPRSGEIDEDVAPGVSRVRPAVFQALSTTQGPSALRAYQPRTAGAEAAPRAERAAAGEKLLSDWGGLLGNGLGVLRGKAAAPARPTVATPDPQPRPAPPAVAPAQTAASASDLEQRLAPLRAISRELVARGMPSSLVAELLAEIVAEYGNQVLGSERDARLALVEQLLLRIPQAPLSRPDKPLTGTYVVTGPAGSGKSVFIAHLALQAAQHGQRDVILVNTESARIGAAAQMNALGQVFGYEVAHIYSPQELRRFATERGSKALILVETAGWSPREGAPEAQRPWKWQYRGAKLVVCVAATAQQDDLNEVLRVTRDMTNGTVAVLTKISETRNVLPALGALATARQAVGMVVPGPNLAEEVTPIDLGDLARSALGVVMPQRKKGRVRC